MNDSKQQTTFLEFIPDCALEWSQWYPQNPRLNDEAVAAAAHTRFKVAIKNHGKSV